MKSFLCLALALAGISLFDSGCTLSRPKGAYKPRQEAREPSVADFESDAGSFDVDGGPRNGLPPSRGLIGTDDVRGLSAEERALLPLTGRYALRADMHSKIRVAQLFARLELDNTATNLSVAEISLDKESGTLQMVERLCYQRYEHDCIQGCSRWTTDVDARVTPFFPYVTRTLEVDGSRFESKSVAQALGFDGSPSDLPSEDGDARVWNVSGDVLVREGVLTRIVAEGTPVGTVDCTVYTVQRFSSSFAGLLKGKQLDQVRAALDTEGTDARRLGASGPSASTCESDSGGALPGKRPNTLAFARIPMERFSDEAFWSCPSLSELEQGFDD